MAPTRPVDGAATETEWGQAVHDAVFTPRGCRVAGGATVAVGTTFEQLQLNTAVDDPGGWLASDHITVPTGGTGLYDYGLIVRTDNGESDERTRVQLRVNGGSVSSFFIEQNGATSETDGRTGLMHLDAGDVITVYAAKTGGLDPDVDVLSLYVIRRGDEMGA